MINYICDICKKPIEDNVKYKIPTWETITCNGGVGNTYSAIMVNHITTKKMHLCIKCCESFADLLNFLSNK